MPHYEFYCEKCEKDITLTLSIGERERGGYKCPGQGAAAADGHVLLQDVEEGLKGRADGGLHSAAAGVATERHDSGEGPPGRRAVSQRPMHRPLVSLSLPHLAQAQPRGDRNARGSAADRSSAKSTVV